MASLINFDEIRERQEEFVSRAREMFDKAIESGKSYVEVTRSNIEAEVDDLFGKVRGYSAKSQAVIQEQAGKQLQSVQKLQSDLIQRTESLLEQYGPELEKRIPVAASAVEFAEQFVKTTDERLKGWLESANGAVASAFPIDSYDELNVADVKKALGDLSRVELEVVKHYEADHKARKSVLKEIDSLLSA